MAKRSMAEDVTGSGNKLAARVKAVDHEVTESQTRQTYYVPADLHRRLKLVAIQTDMKVSDLVVEGIREVLKRHEAG